MCTDDGWMDGCYIGILLPTPCMQVFLVCLFWPPNPFFATTPMLTADHLLVLNLALNASILLFMNPSFQKPSLRQLLHLTEKTEKNIQGHSHRGGSLPSILTRVKTLQRLSYVLTSTVVASGVKNKPHSAAFARLAVAMHGYIQQCMKAPGQLPCCSSI